VSDENYDPYRPPNAEVNPGFRSSFEDQLRYPKARPAVRIINFVLDYVLVTILMVVGLGIIEGISPGYIEHLGAIEERLFGIFGMLFYYVAFEGLFARTPAKWITGTRVITEAGRRPTPNQILGRTLSRFVPFEPVSCLSAQGGWWHDTWSKTMVIQVR
jgi:uncharacterized RDD family membrane protein YckC